jgi:hypothetical protein
VTRQGTILWDTTPIVVNKPEVIPEIRPDPSSSHNYIQFMIDSTLERQAKSTDELLRRLIEEEDEKKLDATNVNPSSSTYVVSFTQTNPHTSGPLVGGTSMPSPSTQLMNHFHSRTTIESLATTFGMPQQTMASMFGQGYTHTVSSFSMPNPGSAPYTSGYNCRAYPNPNGIYQALYTTISYTHPVPLPVVHWVTYPTTLTKTCHVSMPTASRKPAAFVMTPHRSFTLGRSRLTLCPFEPRPSLARILIT